MNFDFDNRASKLDKEAAKRREVAKLKKEREVQAAFLQRQREEELAEVARLRKIEEEVREAERQKVAEAERALTGGIDYSATLIPYEVTDSEDDKVILPENALGYLTTQDAFSNGPAVFQLTVTSKNNSSSGGGVADIKTTHCGVREFSAAADTIGLPKKVIDSLWSDGQPLENVVIKYVRLPKITYVKLEPIANSFFQVEPVKMMLEENLRFHSTLTMGDLMTVWFRGVAHRLRVVEMKPDTKGTLIDTDVEVELTESQEMQKKQGEITAGSSSVTSNGATVDRNVTTSGVFKLASSISTNTTANTNATSNKQVTTSSSVSGKSAGSSSSGVNSVTGSDSGVAIPTLGLPAEPAPGDDVIHVRVKTPTGSTITRRFHKHDPMALLFQFTSSEMNVTPEAVQLTTRFPPRVFTWQDNNPSEVSFVAAGITASQEMFLASLIV